MAEIKPRVINTAIWRDDWFLGLRETEQHLFLYLLSCPASELCGIYRLGLAEAAFHTKIDQAEIKRIFTERFEPDGKAFFEIGYVIMKNWLKHQRLNPNMWKSVQNEINALPDWLRSAIFDIDNRLYIPLDEYSQGRLMVPNHSEPLPNHSERLDEKKLKEKKRKEGKYEGKGNRPAAGGGNGQGGISHLEQEKRRLADGMGM